MKHIIIAGAGPAGAATAIALKRLNYLVSVIASPRGFTACEGLSARVVNGLDTAGCHHALATLAPPSQRQASWNGNTTFANTEQLVRRDQFDNALLQDLKQAGVDVIPGRVQDIKKDGTKITCSGTRNDGGPFFLEGAFLVEARGRSAPGGKQSRIRGPETVSLLQLWQGKPGVAQSAVASMKDGWSWMAQLPDGSRYTQITVAVDAEDFPAKEGLEDYFMQRLQGISEARPFYRDTVKAGPLAVRSTTSVLTCNPIDEQIIRVGDAALAVDPLSGNGIFQSLSTALIAPSIINTLLRKPEQAELAKTFYRERVDHAFMRFARLGRDFYLMEQRWPEEPFWQQRQLWPDQEPAHKPQSIEQLEIKLRPVVRNNFITEQEVVVTPDQPLGIWHLDGIPLAPIVKNLIDTPLASDETLPLRLKELGLPEQKHKHLCHWLESLELV